MSEEQAPPPEEELSEPKAPAKGPKGVILIGALAGGLLLGAGGGLFALGPMLSKKSGYVVSDSVRKAVAADRAEQAASEKGREGKEGEAAASTVHMIDNVILNPAGSGGQRFLMVAAAIDTRDGKVIEEMKARDAETRDVLLRVLGSKTVEQLADMRYREILKKELMDSLGVMFKRGSVRRIYFPQFVIQ